MHTVLPPPPLCVCGRVSRRPWLRVLMPQGTQILSLRGGGEESASKAQEYNSKDAEKYDRVLWDMLTQVRPHARTGEHTFSRARRRCDRVSLGHCLTWLCLRLRACVCP
jgi:hypothetical protein